MLTNSVVWLFWLTIVSLWLSNIIQSVLPQIILTLFTIVLLYILRVIADYKDYSTKTSIELLLQRYYFIFIFLQIFLTVALFFSFTEIVQDILYKLSSVSLLVAQNLFKFCNFFFFYLVIQNFSISAATLLQTEKLFV